MKCIQENIGLICRLEGDFNDPYLNSAVKKTNLLLSKISYHLSLLVYSESSTTHFQLPTNTAMYDKGAFAKSLWEMKGREINFMLAAFCYLPNKMLFPPQKNIYKKSVTVIAKPT